MMYHAGLEHVEALVEEKYDDINLEFEWTSSAVMNSDSERRLRNDHGTDLVITTMPTGDVKNYMLDLSAEPYADAYHASATAAVQIDGQTRYLPLPGQYAGYVLNKTLAEQLGNGSPSSIAELTELFKAGTEQGIGVGEDGTVFGSYLMDSYSMGIYFISTQVPDFLGQVDGIKWEGRFESGEDTFSGVWDYSLDTLKQWQDAGYMRAEVFENDHQSYNNQPTKTRMAEGEFLALYGTVQYIDQLNAKDNGYEYTMLPILSNQGNPSWVTSSPDAYIGINANLEEESDKLDACKRILELLSTNEGQEAWMADTGASISYLNTYTNETDNIPDGIAETVNNGYVYYIQMPANLIRYLGLELTNALTGNCTMEEALAAVDDYAINGSVAVDYEQSVVGSVSEDMLYENYNTRLQETAIGNLVADAVKEYSGAQIAVVNGGGIRASLYQGDVLGADLSAVCPYENLIIVVKAKGSTIRSMLENGVSRTHIEGTPGGRFLQVSGLCYAYKPGVSDKEPSTVTDVTLADGAPLEDSKTYTLAINSYMAGASTYVDNNGDGFTMLDLYSDVNPKGEVTLVKETQATYADALRSYFQEHQDEEIHAVLDGRITVEE